MEGLKADALEVSRALARLESDPLRHITPLKMLALYASHARCEWFGDVLLATMPARESNYDRTTYPNATCIVYPALLSNAGADDIAACAHAIAALARTERIICKTQEDALIAALRKHAHVNEMREVRALCNFLLPAFPSPAGGGSRGRAEALPPEQTHAYAVHYASEITPQARPLLNAHGVYSEAELNAFFANGDARCLWLEANSVVRAVALTFPTTNTIHEIGSVHVAPDARRQGYARALVRAALDELAQRNLTPRYVVDGNNAPSIALAVACGLREAFRLRHFEIPGAQRVS